MPSCEERFNRMWEAMRLMYPNIPKDGKFCEPRESNPDFGVYGRSPWMVYLEWVDAFWDYVETAHVEYAEECDRWSEMILDNIEDAEDRDIVRLTMKGLI